MRRAVRVRLGAEHQRFERVVRRARVAIRQHRDALEDLVARLDVLFAQAAHRVLDRAPQQRDDLLRRQRLQHVDLHPRKQRRDHFERRIFRGRADQQNVSRLHVRQKRVLLRAIEAVHFVDEHDRAPAVAPRVLRPWPSLP